MDIVIEYTMYIVGVEGLVCIYAHLLSCWELEKIDSTTMSVHKYEAGDSLA